MHSGSYAFLRNPIDKNECLIENQSAYVEYEIVENAIGVYLDLIKNCTHTHTRIHTHILILISHHIDGIFVAIFVQ